MMSPEPTQEPVEENLKAPDLNVGATANNESDSEDEEPGLEGYMPLSQVPLDGEPMLDEDEDEEWISNALDPSHMLPSIPARSEVEASQSDTLEVWSSRSNQSDIDLDADKINQVKTAMASFVLPTTAIPEWANNVSEEQWKQILIDRIKEMQSKDN